MATWRDTEAECRSGGNFRLRVVLTVRSTHPFVIVNTFTERRNLMNIFLFVILFIVVKRDLYYLQQSHAVYSIPEIYKIVYTTKNPVIHVA